MNTDYDNFDKHCVISNKTCFQSPNKNERFDEHFELIKIIKRYEYCSGWTMLIGPDSLPDKSDLLACSVNLTKVLTISKRHCSNALSVAYQALKQENCSALVVWCELMSDMEVKLIQQKAKQTETRLYLINRNNHNTNKHLH